MSFKLGKLQPKYHPKTLMMSRFITADLPDPPRKVYREYKIPAGVYGLYDNDIFGDCTCATVAHMVMLFTSHAGTLVVPDLKDVLAMYSAVSGFDITKKDKVTGDNPTDQGAAITDVLNYWQTTGLAGHKIMGWAKIDHTRELRRAQGVWLFGALDVGVQLPAVAQDQFSQGQHWEVVADDGGIEGGHCIEESGYGSQGENYGTWGKPDQKAGRAWTDKYVDEAYVVFTQDWISEATGLAPNGFKVDELLASLKTIAGG